MNLTHDDVTYEVRKGSDVRKATPDFNASDFKRNEGQGLTSHKVTALSDGGHRVIGAWRCKFDAKGEKAKWFRNAQISAVRSLFSTCAAACSAQCRGEIARRAMERSSVSGFVKVARRA